MSLRTLSHWGDYLSINACVHNFFKQLVICDFYMLILFFYFFCLYRATCLNRPSSGSVLIKTKNENTLCTAYTVTGLFIGFFELINFPFNSFFFVKFLCLIPCGRLSISFCFPSCRINFRRADLSSVRRRSNYERWFPLKCLILFWFRRRSNDLKLRCLVSENQQQHWNEEQEQRRRSRVFLFKVPWVMPWLQLLRFDYDTTTIRLRSDYNVSRATASNSTQAKNEHVNFSSYRSRIVVESQLWHRLKLRSFMVTLSGGSSILG